MKSKYQKENLELIVKESLSLAEVLRKLELREVGGNYSTIKKYILKYKIDTSHFTGQAWNKGKSYTDEVSLIKLEDILNENTDLKSNTLKQRLFVAGLKKNICENCGCGDEWMGKPITLELHHINGNHFDNRIENLQILCPNCHSQTTNFRFRNRRKIIEGRKLYQKKEKQISICPNCGKEFIVTHNNSKYCSLECYHKYISKLGNNIKMNDNSLSYNKEFFEQLITTCSTISEMSKKINLSRTSIRKYLEEFDLLDRFKSEYSKHLHNKPIIQYTLDMIPIKEWGSISDAEETLQIKSIGDVCNFKRKTAGGYIWRFK